MSPQGNGERATRRALLRLGGALGIGLFAGCEGLVEDSNGTGTPSPGTESPRPTASPDPSATPVETVTFDGGGAAAFASALRTVEDNPGSTLAIEPGTYHLDGGGVGRDYDAAHFVTYDLADVTIEGNGATVVFEDARRGGLHFFGASNTTVRGLRLEYGPPPYTRGTIVSMDEAARMIEVEIDDGYPAFGEDIFASVDPAWATVHEPDTGDFQDSLCCGGSVINFDPAESLGDGRFRIRNLRPWRGIGVGRDFVAVARVPEGSALQLVGCDGTLVEDVTVHTSPLFVALVALCAGPTFRNVTARPRPTTGRPIATTADGFHVVNCHPGPTFEDCHLERLQDDAFAIDSKMQRVAELVDSRTVRLDVVAATLIRPGDTLEAISPDYGRPGGLPAVERVESGDRGGWPAKLGAPIEVTFAADVADVLEVGSFLLNRSRSNAGFVIRDCTVRELRARHVRITSRDGVVERNAFDGSTSPAILLQPTTGHAFNPKGPAENVTIRNNTMTRTGLNGFTTPWRGAIVVRADIEPGIDEEPPPGQPNRGITVTNNAIRDAAHMGIFVADAADVEVRDNLVENPNLRGFPRNEFGIGFENARDVAVAGNRVVGTGEALREFGVRHLTSALAASGNEFVVDGRAVTPRIVEADSA